MSDFAKVGELYTPLSSAVSMLRDRRANAELCARIQKRFEDSPSPASLAEPCGVYAPALVTPNLELQFLLDVSSAFPFPIRFFEYAEDKFVHMNYSKRCLGELFFYTEENGHRRANGSTKIVDFQSAQGKPMNTITTLSGEGFIDFHHRILRSYLRERAPFIEDFSSWFRKASSFDATKPYLRYLGLFLVDAILFANFSTEKRETSFTDERVLPAFRALRDEFGISPLIVPIQPTESDDDSFWCYYPEEIRTQF